MRNPDHGFSLLELVIAIAILGILAATGIPKMSGWIQSANVKSAAEFYTEGLRLARVEAVRRNSGSRFQINVPDTNGWSVDWCQPTTVAPCITGSGTWTNVYTRAGAAYNNVLLTVCPGGAAEVIFSPVGWVNTQGNAPVSALRIDSPNNTVNSAQLEINLSGVVGRCDPSVTNVSDSRRCQVVCP